MKRYLVVIFLLLLSFNTDSVAQEFKNCVFGKNSLFFIIDESTNTITQLNKAKGTKRIFTNLKIGTRVDKEQTMEDKVNVVEQKLNLDAKKK